MEFTMRNEIFFVSYDDIIKSTSVAVMRELCMKYMEYYDDFIDLSFLSDVKVYDDFVQFVNSRSHKSVFESLALKKFDYKQAWTDIYLRKYNLIQEAPLLSFGTSLHNIIKQKFTDKIYIWTETYDERIHHDLSEIYSMNKMTYICGDFFDVVQKIDTISCFVLDDIEHLYLIMEMGKHKLCNVLLADYNYNYIQSEEVSRDLRLENLPNMEVLHKFKLTLFKAD